MEKEVYFYGDEKEIDKIILFFKERCHLGESGIRLVDLRPELTDRYVTKENIRNIGE